MGVPFAFPVTIGEISLLLFLPAFGDVSVLDFGHFGHYCVLVHNMLFFLGERLHDKMSFASVIDGVSRKTQQRFGSRNICRKRLTFALINWTVSRNAGGLCVFLLSGIETKVHILKALAPPTIASQ